MGNDDEEQQPQHGLARHVEDEAVYPPLVGVGAFGAIDGLDALAAYDLIVAFNTCDALGTPGNRSTGTERPVGASNCP